MRVLVAGATGVIGRQLVPMLTSVGHSVVGLARSTGRTSSLEQVGAEVVTADALDSASVTRAVRDAAPDAVIHLLTAIPAQINPKKLADQFQLTNRLRTEGTRNLVEAASAAGVKRFIAQGLAYAYDPTSGTGPADEDTALWRDPPKQFVPVLAALKELEQQTGSVGGLVLRFGHLYGPGSIYAPDGSFVQQVRAGKVPLVGDGGSVFSFTHAHDAASAVVAALDKNVSGALNVVDDEPTPMRDWLPELARLLNAKAPQKVPPFMAKMFVGGWGVAFMTQLRGADNSRARLQLDWRPRFASWRAGFAEELSGK